MHPPAPLRPGPFRRAAPPRAPRSNAGFALALLALTFDAGAQTRLDPVVVEVTRGDRPPLDVPAAVDVLTRAEVRDGQWRINLSEALAGVPGVVALNRQNYAQDLQLSIRGFGARSTFGVRGVRLYVDGVPQAMPDGQGHVASFPLDAVERIEVLRGPYSALYGNSAGGVIALSTRLPAEPWNAAAGVATGSDATTRAVATVAGGDAQTALSVNGNFFTTAGYRDHSAATRTLLNLRAAAWDTPAGALRVALNALDMPDTQDPLGLTRAQAAADPRQAAPQALQFDTRKSVRQVQAGADLAGGTGVLGWNVAGWLGTRSVTQFQAIPVATQLAPTSPGGVIDLQRTFGGIDARLQGALGGAATWTLGLASESMGEDRRGYRNFIGTPSAPVPGVQGALRRDERNTVQSLDPYAQIEAALGERWRAVAGVRLATLRVVSDDRFLANGDDSGRLRFSAATPTAGLVFRLAPDASLYAAYGRGFETPTLNELAYRADGSAGLNTALRAASSDNFEVGAKLARGPLQGTLAVYRIRTADEIVVRTNAGGRASFGNAAGSTRDGAELGVAWRVLPPLTLALSVAVIDARFTQGFLTCTAAPCVQPGVPVAAGNRIPGVPARTAEMQARWRAAWADVSVQWAAQSALWVDDRNSDRAAGSGRLNLALARDLAWDGGRARVFTRIDNVLAQRAIGSVIVNEANGRFFEPAPGRTLMVGIDVPH